MLDQLNPSGSGAYYGSAVGGAIGTVAGSRFGPIGAAVGGIVGGAAGGAIGGYFDPPGAGEAGYGENGGGYSTYVPHSGFKFQPDGFPKEEGVLVTQMMMQYVRAYLVGLVFSTLSYAFLMYPVIGMRNGIMAGCLFGLFLTTFFFIIFVPMDYLKRRKYPAEAFNFHQRICLKMPISGAEAFTLCEEAIKRYVRIKNVVAIKEKCEINAHTKMSALAFGERIHIHLDCPSSAETVVCIESKPVLKYTLFDYGRNYENVIYIKEHLEKTLDRKGVGPEK